MVCFFQKREQAFFQKTLHASLLITHEMHHYSLVYISFSLTDLTTSVLSACVCMCVCEPDCVVS